MVGLLVVRVNCWHQCQMTYKYDLMFEKKKIDIYPCVVNYNKVHERKPRAAKTKQTILLKFVRLMCGADRVSTSL